MTRVIASVVLKNEAEKYLSSFLEWNSSWWDEVFFYDDQSSDDTAKMCSEYGKVFTRPNDVPSFIENEGAYRSAAWKTMNSEFVFGEDDWILSLDADEFLVGTMKNFDPRVGLLQTIESANNVCMDAVALHVPEVWHHDMVPLVRVDGFWKKNWNMRLVNAKRKGSFKDGMGCGSVPNPGGNLFKSVKFVSLLHYGYTIPGAIESKHKLYTKNPGRHNKKHIESIVATPELVEWKGQVPKCRLGRHSV